MRPSPAARRHAGRTLACCAALLELAAPGPARAEAASAGRPEGGALSITERLNERIPAGLAFVASDGREVRLGELGGRGKPVVLSLVYYQCPTLCGLLLSGLTEALRASGLALGDDYELVTVSFDSRETAALAAERKARFLQALGRPDGGAHWHFLVGEPDPVRALAESVGFPYRWDERTAQYAHLAALVVLTPDGRIARYLYGVSFPPRDLRLALVEASEGRVGTAFDRVLLTCYRFDPASRRYALFVSGFLRAGGLAVFVGLAGMLVALWRRERVRVRAGGRW